MAIRNIVTEGDDILTKPCRKVEKFDARLHQLIDDMIETLAAAQGAGLAAPQVGVLRQICVIDAVEGEAPLELINPEIIAQKGSQTDAEGCLSFPGQWGMITRPDHVKIRAQDRNGNWFEKEGSGLLAQAMLHESGHLDGHAFKEDPTFSPLTEEEAEALSRAQEEK